jgi:hypothetical protein
MGRGRNPEIPKYEVRALTTWIVDTRDLFN